MRLAIRIDQRLCNASIRVRVDHKLGKQIKQNWPERNRWIKEPLGFLIHCRIDEWSIAWWHQIFRWCEILMEAVDEVSNESLHFSLYRFCWIYRLLPQQRYTHWLNQAFLNLSMRALASIIDFGSEVHPRERRKATCSRHKNHYIPHWFDIRDVPRQQACEPSQPFWLPVRLFHI